MPSFIQYKIPAFDRHMGVMGLIPERRMMTMMMMNITVRPARGVRAVALGPITTGV